METARNSQEKYFILRAEVYVDIRIRKIMFLILCSSSWHCLPHLSLSVPLFPLYRFMQMTHNVFFFYPPDLHSNVNHILVIHSPPHASQPIHVISSLPSCHALSYSHSSTLFHSTLKFTFSINPFHHRSRLIPAFTNSRLYDGFCF